MPFTADEGNEAWMTFVGKLIGRIGIVGRPVGLGLVEASDHAVPSPAPPADIVLLGDSAKPSCAWPEMFLNVLT